jgi:replicative DNA helicase
MSEGHFRSAADLFGDWRDEVLSGKAPALYPVGTGELGRIEIGPGLVTLFGGAPGAGKTALVMQIIAEALRLTPDLRALVCNVEMSPTTLLDRQLARLSGVDASTIRHRRMGAGDIGAINRGMEALEGLADRLAFIRPPFSLENVARSADAFDASLIAIDYIQRVGAPGDHGDKRGSVDATMSYLRQFADAGIAVLIVSAVGRSKDSKGRSSYAEGLNLASFRETSEIEYGADDAYMLVPDGGDDSAGSVVLKHLKSRHGEARDIALEFDRGHQRFGPVKPAGPPAKDAGKLRATLLAAWNGNEAGGEGTDG